MKRLTNLVLETLKHMPRSAKQRLLLSIDVLLVPVALLSAVGLVRGQWAVFFWPGHEWPVMLALMALGAGLSLTLGLPKIQLKSYELSSVGRSGIVACGLGFGLWLVSLANASLANFSIAVAFALFYLCLSALLRVAMLVVLIQIYRRDTAETRVLIYGAGSTGMQLALALKAHVAIRAWGFIDDNPALHGMTVAGLRVFPPQRLEKLISENGIERVIIAMPSLSHPKQARFARRVARLGVEVQALPSFGQLVGGEQVVDRLSSILPRSFLNREGNEAELGLDLSAYHGKSVLISGAGGSIGSEIGRQILNCRPARLVLYELNEFALFATERELRSLSEGSGCEIVAVLGSITDAQRLSEVLKRHDVKVVLHAAAYKHVSMVERNPEAGVYNNVFGTLRLASAAAEAGVERFIQVSTDKAVRPVGLMGATKRLAEIAVADLARRSGATRFATVRFGNVLGSSGSVIPLFEEQILSGGPVTVTDEEVTRYFMTISEAVRLVLTAGDMANGGEIFVLDMGKPVKIYDLARQMIESSGYSLRSPDNPDGDIELKFTGLGPGEKLHEELSISRRLEASVHPKIFRVPDRHLSEFETARALQAVAEALENGTSKELIDEVRHWVRRDLEQNNEAFGIAPEEALAR